MELSTKVIHDAFEEGVRGERKTSVNMAEEQDALPLLGHRLRLALRRQPPRLVDDHAMLHQLQQVVRRHRGGEEIPLDPTRRQCRCRR